jgi:hypothetical protein
MLAILCLFSGQLSAQVSVTLAKSGADVVLTWSGGTGPYSVLRAATPDMTSGLATLTTDGVSPFTDSAPPTPSWYIVNDADAPTVTVTTPGPGFESGTPCVCVEGAASESLARAYVNGVSASVLGPAWTACPDGTGVPLAIASPGGYPPTPVTVVVVDETDNYGVAVVTGTYVGSATMAVCTPRPHGF